MPEPPMNFSMDRPDTPHPGSGTLSPGGTISSSVLQPEAAIEMDPSDSEAGAAVAPTSTSPPSMMTPNNPPATLSTPIFVPHSSTPIPDAAILSPAQLALENEMRSSLAQTSSLRDRMHGLRTERGQQFIDGYMETRHAAQTNLLTGLVANWRLQPAPIPVARVEKRKAPRAGCDDRSTGVKRERKDGHGEGDEDDDQVGDSLGKTSNLHITAPSGVSDSSVRSSGGGSSENGGERVYDGTDVCLSSSESEQYRADWQIKKIMSVEYMLNVV